MINKRELRIGNIFFSENMAYTNSKIQTVISIGDDGVNAWQDMGASGVIGYEEMKPIELTEEWLLKLGFERTLTVLGSTVKIEYVDYRQGFMTCYKIDQHFEIEYSGISIDNRIFITNCSFVHQLQNLYFALTGKELQCRP